MKDTLFTLSLMSLLLVCQFLRGDAGVTLPDEWSPPVGLQYNMTLYAQALREDDTPVETAGSRLAVFDAKGECRGVADLMEGPSGKLFSLLVCSDMPAETGFSLKVLDAETGETIDLQETIAFTSDAILPDEGGLFHPMQLHAVPDAPSVRWELKPGWSLVGLTHALTEAGTEAFQALCPIALDNACYVQCLVPKAGQGYWVFSRAAKTVKLSVDETQGIATPVTVPGWNLVAYADGCAWPEKASQIWEWRDGCFALVAKENLEEGRGYLTLMRMMY